MRRTSSAFAPELLHLTRVGLRAPDEPPLERAEHILRQLPEVAAGIAHEVRERKAAQARADAADLRRQTAEHEAERLREQVAGLSQELGTLKQNPHPGSLRTDFTLDEVGTKRALAQEEIAAAAIRTREKQLDLERRAVATEQARAEVEVTRAEAEVTRAEAEVTRAGVKTPKSDADLTKTEIERIRNEASIRRVEASELYALYRDFIAKRDENAEIMGEAAAQEIFRQSRRSLGLDDDSPFLGDPQRGGRR